MEVAYSQTAEEFGALCRDAGQYFDRLEEVGVPKVEEERFLLAPVTKVEVPNSELAACKALEKRVFALGRELAYHASRSELIDKADQKDLREAVKEMSAAVRLRRYVYQDVYVHHDEDQVLGVSPPSQWEDVVALQAAREEFQAASARVSRIFELFLGPESTRTADQAAAATTKYRPGTAFIMMRIDPQAPELDDVKDTIKAVFKRFGIEAVRSDEIEHSDVITELVLQEIASSEFLIADLSHERPSVYYEIGYGHALKRRVILYRKKGTRLHFDLAGHNCPEYENLADLRQKLTKRLESLTNAKPKEE